MKGLFSAAAGGDAAALAGVAALVTIVAVVPSAVIFVINQLIQNRKLRDEKYRYLREQYIAYLELRLAHPDVGLEYGDDGPRKLTAAQRRKLYTIYDIATSLLELAFKTYRSGFSSSRGEQWSGWRAYSDWYAAQPNYRQYWIDAICRGDASLLDKDWSELRALNLSGYDVRFERFMFERIALNAGQEQGAPTDEAGAAAPPAG